MQFQQSEDESQNSQSSFSVERYLQFTPLREVSPMPNQNQEDNPQRNLSFVARNNKSSFKQPQTLTIEEYEEHNQSNTMRSGQPYQQNLERSTISQQNTTQISSILKLQNGKYSNTKAFMEPILNRFKTEKIHSVSSSQERQKKQVLKNSQQISTKKPTQNNIIQKNIQNAGKKQQKQPEQRKRIQSQVELKTAPVNEAAEKKFNDALERWNYLEKRRLDGLKKLQEENDKKNVEMVSERPRICEKSTKILERTLKNKHANRGEVIEEIDEYILSYVTKEKQIQVDLIDGLQKIREASQLQPPQVIKEGGSEGEEDQGKISIGTQTDEIKLKIIKKKIDSQTNKKELNTAKEDVEKQKAKKKTNKKKTQAQILEPVGELKKLEYYVPIHERYAYIIKKKEKWIAEQQQLKREEQEKLELQEIEKSKKDIAPLTEEQVEEFVKSQLDWYAGRNQELLKKRMDKDEVEIKKLTFKPEISAKSQHMVANVAQEPVEERLYKFQAKKMENLSKLEQKYLPLFKPNVGLSDSKTFNASLSQLNTSKTFHDSFEKQGTRSKDLFS